MASVANENGGLDSMVEAKTACSCMSELSTGNVSFKSRPIEEEYEEEDDQEEEEYEEEEEDDDKDGSECSSKRRELSGLEPAKKRFKACLGNVEEEDEAIDSRIEILQTLVPGGYGMDTIPLLEQTACYIKFLMEVVNL
ncbi:transcription factor HEC3 [Cryptomeria japonica]|uniref:transcription factor HEC3 n=1 Tax=Cryptomeria japonica TaxID=3369 RepID=UPI0025AC08EA|nr:transcription factor HEC3 [Cryptomeria japonica]